MVFHVLLAKVIRREGQEGAEEKTAAGSADAPPSAAPAAAPATSIKAEGIDKEAILKTAELIKADTNKVLSGLADTITNLKIWLSESKDDRMLAPLHEDMLVLY